MKFYTYVVDLTLGKHNPCNNPHHKKVPSGCTILFADVSTFPDIMKLVVMNRGVLSPKVFIFRIFRQKQLVENKMSNEKRSNKYLCLTNEIHFRVCHKLQIL